MGYFNTMTYTEANSGTYQTNPKSSSQNPEPHTLWQPNQQHPHPEPLWHLRVCVLNDHEGRGDCPSRGFAFKTLPHLTTAADALISAFGTEFSIKKCGIDVPDAMGGRVNDGRSQTINISFQSNEEGVGAGAKATMEWRAFLKRLLGLEAEWEREGMCLL